MSWRDATAPVKPPQEPGSGNRASRVHPAVPRAAGHAGWRQEKKETEMFLKPIEELTLARVADYERLVARPSRTGRRPRPPAANAHPRRTAATSRGPRVGTGTAFHLIEPRAAEEVTTSPSSPRSYGSIIVVRRPPGCGFGGGLGATRYWGLTTANSSESTAQSAGFPAIIDSGRPAAAQADTTTHSPASARRRFRQQASAEYRLVSQRHCRVTTTPSLRRNRPRSWTVASKASAEYEAGSQAIASTTTPSLVRHRPGRRDRPRCRRTSTPAVATPSPTTNAIAGAGLVP
jgi:hypothetical protein